ncbi:MAG TPA: chemotaxis protein CheB [Anaerolineales bacterium]|nr:chemotaxis protein CheB [Anaerolineales bacterium]
MAHEINNPLQAVQGCLSLLVEELSGPQRQEKVDSYLNIIDKEVERVVGIVHGMRDFARPAPVGTRSTDGISVLKDVLALADKQLQHNKVNTECSWGINVPSIQANPNLLKQVFLNMDIRMPIMDGLEATRQIMQVRPTPIIVVASSVHEAEYNIAFNALEAGALTVIEKPAGLLSTNFDTVRDQMINMIRTMAGIKVISHNKTFFSAGSIGPMTAILYSLFTHPIRIVAIAASTGGPPVLKYIFDNLPKDFSIPVVVVQHVMDSFAQGMAEWLNSSSPLTVKTAVDQERLVPGKVYIAPGQSHLTVATGNTISLVASPPVRGHRPSANLLFDSVAKTFGKDSVGIILTGMGDDGADGLQALGKTGAHIIAQNQASSVVFGMPKVAIERGTVDEILSPSEIVNRLIKLHTRSMSVNRLT